MDITQYFHRKMLFARREGEVSLVDVHAPSVFNPLEPWLAAVINLADGKHTVREFAELARGRYTGPVPENLEKTIQSVFERLVEAEAIGLKDGPVSLPYYLEVPLSELDLEKAKRQMIEDGYVVGSD